MKYKLIYIIGSGFSGSTFLDMLLGSHKDVLSLGEVMFLPDYMMYGKKCTCGKILEQCDLWGRVIPSPDTPEMNYYSANYHHDKYYDQLQNADAYDNADNREYALYQFDLLRRIADATGKKALVDSSKNIPRLKMYLQSCPDDFEISAVHLIRDPLGNVHSTKNWYGRKESYLSLGYSWMRLNQMIFSYLKGEAIPSYVLFYKDLCLRTLEEANRILRISGIDEWKELPEFSLEGKHNIEGNPTRFNFKKVNYSQKWKKELPARGVAACAPLMVPYAMFRVQKILKEEFAK